MVVFWSIAVLMTAAALAFVLVPLLRERAAPRAPSIVEANLEVLRGQRREIEADVATGVLPADARDEALAELVRRAEDDLAAPATAPEPVAPRRPWPLAAAIAVLVPAIAFATYLALGTPGATDPAVMRAASGKMEDHEVMQMVEALAAKMKERPDDPKGWSLLARSMGALGRFDQAADAYANLARLVPNDADVLADWADALGMAQGRTLAGKPMDLVQQALRIDPRHHKALALAGTAAMDSGDFPAAARYWQTLAAQLPPGSDEETQIQQVIAEVRDRARQAGKPLPAAATAPAAAAPKAAAPVASAPAEGRTITGSVSLSPAIASKVKGSEALFVLARAENGPRVPLAVVRKTAADLPFQFQLDDSQSMAAGMNISSAQAVRVEARVSISGNATPQPGDLVGTSAVVKPGARDVKIVLDKVLP